MHFVQGEIWPLISRDDAEDDLLRGLHYIERRDQAHATDQSMETDNVGDIVLLVAERVGHGGVRRLINMATLFSLRSPSNRHLPNHRQHHVLQLTDLRLQRIGSV